MKNTRPIPGIEEILNVLRKKYRLALVSNTHNIENRAIDKSGVKGFFDVIVLSYEIGKIKPEKGIFDEACSRLSVGPSSCLFIDDLKRNTEEAKKYGMATIHFQDTRQLKSELSSFSIKL